MMLSSFFDKNEIIYAHEHQNSFEIRTGQLKMNVLQNRSEYFSKKIFFKILGSHGTRFLKNSFLIGRSIITFSPEYPNGKILTHIIFNLGFKIRHAGLYLKYWTHTDINTKRTNVM